MGDGGGGGDPQETGQDLNRLLGKMLRIDVNAPTYTIPPTNPFAGATPGLDEIWAYGASEPWRFSHDRLTGDLYIADVGQNTIEEVDVSPPRARAAGATAGTSSRATRFDATRRRRPARPTRARSHSQC
jgi:hypothetical protein